MELSRISWSVHTLDCTIMTVITEMMLQLNVQVRAWLREATVHLKGF